MTMEYPVTTVQNEMGTWRIYVLAEDRVRVDCDLAKLNRRLYSVQGLAYRQDDRGWGFTRQGPLGDPSSQFVILRATGSDRKRWEIPWTVWVALTSRALGVVTEAMRNNPDLGRQAAYIKAQIELDLACKKVEDASRALALAKAYEGECLDLVERLSHPAPAEPTETKTTEGG